MQNNVTIDCVFTQSHQSNCQVTQFQSQSPECKANDDISIINLDNDRHNQNSVRNDVINSRSQNSNTYNLERNHISYDIGIVNTHNLWLCGVWTSARQPLLKCNSGNSRSINQDESKFCDWNYSEYDPIYPTQCPQLSVIEPYSFENISIISNGANNFNPLSDIFTE